MDILFCDIMRRCSNLHEMWVTNDLYAGETIGGYMTAFSKTDLRRLTFVDTSTDRREPSLSLRTYLCIELACAISTYWEVLEHFRFAGKEPGLSEGADLVLTEVRKKKIRTLDIREITPLSDSVLDLLRTGPTRHPDSRGSTPLDAAQQTQV
ncbi:hypothetical protein CC2G_007001 [Coprinopsis cinerea AmutBmut pab1-1]|nr:hypothetical protein CC2G_007001 [Coprinopsis cinerea AmutBmut pab1-1]